MANSLLQSTLAAAFVSLIVVVYGDSYGEYPSTYPFDADFVDFPDTGMPDFTHDDTDTGGYYLYGAIKKSMDEQSGPNFYSMGPGMEYFWFPENLGKGLWDMSLLLSPLSSWNCTAAGNFFNADNFPGIQNGEEICTSCCEGYLGQAMFGDDTEQRQNLFADFISSNGCAIMTEEVYCVTGDSWHWICMDGYTTREERAVAKPCLDSFAIHMADCTLLKVSGVHSYLESIHAEPQSYLDSMSNYQTFSMYSLEYSTFDRVCHPYSYYNPEAEEGGSNVDSWATAPAIIVTALAACLSA